MSDVPPGAQPVPMPGPMSNRSDQAPGQPIRVPTGLPYGQAKQVEQMQQAAAIPALAAPNGPTRPPAPAGASPMGPTPGGIPPAPNALEMLSHPTQRPDEAVTTPSSINTKTVPIQQVVSNLETLIAMSDHVPDNVMKLYQQLRMEASGAGPAGTVFQ